jgi:hypothetical protein
MTILPVSANDLLGQTAASNGAAGSAGWHQFQDLLNTAISQTQTNDTPAPAPPPPATPAVADPAAATQVADSVRASRAADAKAEAAARLHRLAFKHDARTEEAADGTATAAPNSQDKNTATLVPGSSPAASPDTAGAGTAAAPVARGQVDGSASAGGRPDSRSTDAAAATDSAASGNSANQTDAGAGSTQTPLTPPTNSIPAQAPPTAAAAIVAAAAAAVQAQAGKTAASGKPAVDTSGTLLGISGLILPRDGSSAGVAAKTGTGALTATLGTGGDPAAALAAGQGTGGEIAATFGDSENAAVRSGTAADTTTGGQAGTGDQSNSQNGNGGDNSSQSAGNGTNPGTPSPAASIPATLTTLLASATSPVYAAASQSFLAGPLGGRCDAAAEGLGAQHGDPALSATGLGLGEQGFSTLSPVASPEAASGSSPYAPTHAPFPVEQVALAIGRLAGGARSFNLQLNPEHLGTVDVNMEVDAKGKTKVTISADRPETLALLKVDSHHLVKALQDSGVSADQSSLSFSLREQGSNTAQDRRGGNNQNGRSAAASAEGELRAVVAPAQMSLSRHLYDIRA